MNAPVLEPLAQAAAAAHAGPRQGHTEFDRLLQRQFSPQDLMEGDSLDRIERIAKRMSEGRMTVPEYLRGNVGDCMAIAMQAMLWNMDPFAVAQKTHIVSGRLGYEAQLVNAVVMASGAIRGSFRYEYRGDGASLECRVGAALRGEGEFTWGEWLVSSQVATKNSPLWKVNPRQQMGYLQVKNWARAFCPGAILGVYTVEDLEDLPPIQPPRSAADAPAQPKRPELPDYDAKAFDKNLPAWTKLVAEGKKEAADLLAMLSTKATFSDEQKKRLLSLKRAAPPAEAEPPPATTSATDEWVADMEAAEGGTQ
jgi:hypothetical protein